MNKPICIAIEGVDCAGKGTAAKRVVKKLKALHPDKKIQLVSFPQYELASGVLIKKFLNGDYKDLVIKPKNNSGFNLDGIVNVINNVNFAASLYEVNRAEYFHLNPPDDETIYVFDRYVYSNLTHQLGRIYNIITEIDDIKKEKDLEKRNVEISHLFRPLYNALSEKWLSNEYYFSGIPIATTIYLDIDIEEAMSRLALRKANKHEGGDILETRENMTAAVEFIRWMKKHIRKENLKFMEVPRHNLIDDIVNVVEEMIKKEE